ncbi:EVE domain-containing protein [Roseateles chitinivorans]|uniref:EVE domain-containing protein n=1 Tax=Roseateles chitinivorans TaxID=2917965 RepID=UPI003D66715F
MSALFDEAGSRAPRAWIAVASAEHVRRGRAEGFMQVCHGKVAPLRRVRPGDRVVYYSPATQMGGKDRLQCFTALGTVRDGDAYEVDMGGGFRPFRRDVDWQSSTREASIHPLLDRLAFTAGKTNWGHAFRFGLIEIDAADMGLIAAEMTGT